MNKRKVTDMDDIQKPYVKQRVKLLGSYLVTMVGIGGIIFLSLSLLPLAATEQPISAPTVVLD